MAAVMKRGALIVVEGVDRCGKSTQCRKLVENLNARLICSQLVNFPDRKTEIGNVIDDYLKTKLSLCDEAVHLLFAANRWEKQEEMKSLLSKGVTLIVDRYSYSGIAYSSVKPSNMKWEWCLQSENGLLKPDVVFLLNLPPEISSTRSGFGAERYENADLQHKVSKTFLKLSEMDDNWDVIDANKGIEELQDVLLQKTTQAIKHAQVNPLKLIDFSK